MAPSPLRGRSTAVLLLLGLALLLDAGACVARRRSAFAPLPAAASTHLAAARAALEVGDEGVARAAAELARAAAPDWVGPARVLDEIDRGAHRGSLVLAARLEELAARGEDAALAYLVGRLEGAAGLPRLEAAARRDPGLAWAHHGIAWNRFQAGDARGALVPGRRAVERAREAGERVHFTVALARYLGALEREEEAVSSLESCLAGADLEPFDRREAASWLVVLELAASSPTLAERGFQRGLALLAGADLSGIQCRRVVAALAGAAGFPARSARARDLEAALAARPGPGRDLLRAELLRGAGEEELVLALARRSSPDPGLPALEDPERRAERIVAGEGRAAIEDWRAALPFFLVDAAGLPRDPSLRRLVEAARAPDSPAARRELGEALLAAGWLVEARAQAGELAAVDPDGALDLAARAARGLAFLGGLHTLFAEIDGGERPDGVWRPRPEDPLRLERIDGRPGTGRGAPVTTVAGLLAAIQPRADRLHQGSSTPAEDVTASPLQSYGFAATLVHPGPRFSAADEEAGQGEEGAAVGGLAAELAALGRFGVFGQAVGSGGPDGTVRQLLGIEEVEGAHLGVPFRGTVAWCQGADLPSRPGRQGARVTGAALHEGYWIDVASLHDDWRAWCELERRALREGRVDVEGVLAGRGPRVAVGPIPDRRAIYALAGLGDLLRLRVLSERAALSRAEGEWLVAFDELLRAVAIHEEGHLCDRTRFLPVSSHLFSALRLFAAAGFSPRRLAADLEYRAQLVALAEVADPRLPLADTLDAAAEGNDLLPHAAAYGRLLADLLAVLDEDLARFPALDGERYLVHQLHHLGAEEVRELARRLAARRGLARR
ncbi:MAG: hypothetical protein AB1726_17375 [Planctomycetota bacterium]